MLITKKDMEYIGTISLCEPEENGLVYSCCLKKEKCDQQVRTFN